MSPFGLAAGAPQALLTVLTHVKTAALMTSGASRACCVPGLPPSLWLVAQVEPLVVSVSSDSSFVFVDLRLCWVGEVCEHVGLCALGVSMDTVFQIYVCF